MPGRERERAREDQGFLTIHSRSPEAASREAWLHQTQTVGPASLNSGPSAIDFIIESCPATVDPWNVSSSYIECLGARAERYKIWRPTCPKTLQSSGDANFWRHYVERFGLTGFGASVGVEVFDGLVFCQSQLRRLEQGGGGRKLLALAMAAARNASTVLACPPAGRLLRRLSQPLARRHSCKPSSTNARTHSKYQRPNLKPRCPEEDAQPRHPILKPTCSRALTVLAPS